MLKMGMESRAFSRESITFLVNVVIVFVEVIKFLTETILNLVQINQDLIIVKGNQHISQVENYHGYILLHWRAIS